MAIMMGIRMLLTIIVMVGSTENEQFVSLVTNKTWLGQYGCTAERGQGFMNTRTRYVEFRYPLGISMEMFNVAYALVNQMGHNLNRREETTVTCATLEQCFETVGLQNLWAVSVESTSELTRESQSCYTLLQIVMFKKAETVAYLASGLSVNSTFVASILNKFSGGKYKISLH